jgi:hypothetical protein
MRTILFPVCKKIPLNPWAVSGPRGSTCAFLALRERNVDR